MAADQQRLARLRDLEGYAVVSDDPDPRGWDVMTRDGQRVGLVDDLIVDREAEQARYLEVHLEQGTEHRHVLVPTDAVHIGDEDRERHVVRVGAGLDYFTTVTPYEGLPLTHEQETEYRACPAAAPTGTQPGQTRIRRGGLTP
jgi:sporulation protein YlmC with PRC-barrel domain